MSVLKINTVIFSVSKRVAAFKRASLNSPLTFGRLFERYRAKQTTEHRLKILSFHTTLWNIKHTKVLLLHKSRGKITGGTTNIKNANRDYIKALIKDS